VTTVEALLVVENTFVYDLAELRSCHAASGAAEQCAEKCSGDAAEGNADWTTDYADGATKFSTTQGARGTTGCTSDGTDHTPCSFGGVLGNNAFGLTLRTD
jgi:hypothetical protein